MGQRASAGDTDAGNALVKKRPGEEWLQAAADDVVNHRWRMQKFERCHRDQVGPHACDANAVAHQHGSEDIRAA
jgi:hypothetical protein